MAKGAYIGNNYSRKVKKIYLGVNGASRKVKKGYIGVNGSARLFYTSGYIWKRYTAISNYTYHWNRYDIKEVQDDNYSVQITSRHFYLKIRAIT